MPEGPETIIMAEMLNKKIKNMKINELRITSKSRYFDSNRKIKIKNEELFENNSIILSVTSHSKKIIFKIRKSNNDIIYFVSFMGMEGRWLLNKGESKHIAIILYLSSDIESFKLYYDDSRHFGLFDIYDKEGLDKIFSKFGPDYMVDQITLKDFKSKIIQKDIAIANWLVDPKYFSGLGNYLRSDILYHAKISPFRLLKSLSKDDIKTLYNSIYIILNKSYQSGGLTLKSYHNPNGEKGSYIPLIYGLKKTLNNNKVTKDILGKDRSIYWSKEVQI